MLINCIGCGVTISARKEKCPYCKTNNTEVLEMLSGIKKKAEKEITLEKLKGTIFSLVHRY